MDQEATAQPLVPSDNSRHRTWVKSTHWVGTASFLLLVFSGYVILMVHPRLYWGEVGNDLTPALFELPISKNHQHGGWAKAAPFFDAPGSPVSSSRTFEIFNQNGWGRSLHFLSAWFLVFTGLIYLLLGIFSGHFRKNLVPGKKEFSLGSFIRDIAGHLRINSSAFQYGPQYGLVQKCTYIIVLVFLVPVIVLTGLTMSPAVAAAYPVLLKLFFGAQSARTIHFFTATLLVIFLVVHIVMIIRTGFKQHIRSMTFGK
ncbi:MAG: cytochrome b/b6 domain-containing protein [Dyadobacter sp.]|uniref:cytochrome b/b6 domain-containing protein n=1 Tax=Dyadobacter sp. TaxID=1914288 RepID=UPI003265D5AD